MKEKGAPVSRVEVVPQEHVTYQVLETWGRGRNRLWIKSFEAWGGICEPPLWDLKQIA